MDGLFDNLIRLLSSQLFVSPIDGSEGLVEFPLDLAEVLHVRFSDADEGGRGHRLYLGVGVLQANVSLLVLNQAVAVKVDGFEQSAGQVIHAQLGQLMDKQGQYRLLLLPFQTALGEECREEFIGADKGLDGALALHPTLVVRGEEASRHRVEQWFESFASGFAFAPKERVEVLYLLRGVDPVALDGSQQVVELVRICLPAEDGRLIEGLEALFHLVVVINEVKYEGVLLPRAGAVQAREGLDGLQSVEGLVDVHGVQ